MERILVGVEPERSSLFGVIRAFNLAKRMNVTVSILFVEEEGKPEGINKIMKNNLEIMIEKGRSEGINIDYYITKGSYEAELLKFIKENKITLLVVGLPREDSKTGENSLMDIIKRVRERVDCRIEIVHERKTRLQEKGVNYVALISTNSGK